jgi:D-alanyl-lipoteichoic acid acyltransferase DltB (MBOAT superfamily)
MDTAGLAACLSGLAGAFCLMVGLSIDFFTGDSGFGRAQWALIGTGLAAVTGGLGLQALAGAARAEVLRTGAVMLQAALAYLVVRVYELETAAFHDFLFGVIVTGFVARHFLPENLRIWFFVLLSLAVMFGILGPLNGAVAFAISLGLIGLCHLPLALWLRVALLVAAALPLAAIRAGWVELDAVASALPIIGSIFMFRVIVYLYDMQNGKVPADLGRRLSYFFILPNFAFPFFPVIDNSVWQRSYKPAATSETYQRGLTWITIGICHLMLYRLVNYRLAFDPSDVQGFGMFLWYAVTNYGLYLKISGLFHLILGCLFLFGFALPETHSRYYLSFSFIEFWRRINIYWKDFMQKMVFNPVFTWAKRRGLPHLGAIITAILAVFVLTWVLHAYQWFWLRGTFLFTGPDILFWTALGVFLVIQTLRESQPARRPARALVGPAALKAIRTAATMLTIVILWSMWSSESMVAWFGLLGRAGLTLLDPTAGRSAGGVLQSAAFVGFLALILAIALGFTFGLAHSGPSEAGGNLASRRRAFPFLRHALTAAATCLSFIVLQQPQVYGLLPRDWQHLAVDMGTARLSARDQVKLERGYYENLTDVRIINSELWNMQSGPREDAVAIDQTTAVEHVKDYRDYVLRPDVVIPFKGTVLSTNSFGMRDRDYALQAAPGVRRIALIGDSRAMGTGVGDEQTFENLVEDRLNARLGGGIELLNFGVAGYDAFQKNLSLDEVLPRFAPGMVLYLSHNTELELRRHFGLAVSGGRSPGAVVEPLLAEAGIVAGMSPDAILERARAITPDLVRAAYQDVVRKTRAAGALPVWVFLPSTQGYAEPLPEGATLRQLAEEAGFVTIDLYDIYNPARGNVEALWISAQDDHPNAMANAIIAERLEAELMARPEIAAFLGGQ